MRDDKFKNEGSSVIARVTAGQTAGMMRQQQQYNIGSAALQFVAEQLLPDYNADHQINDAGSATSRRGPRRGVQNPLLGLVADAVERLDGIEVDSEASGNPLKGVLKDKFDKLKNGRDAEDILKSEKVALSYKELDQAKKIADNITNSVIAVLQENQVDVQSVTPSREGDDADKFLEFVSKRLQSDVGVVSDESKAQFVEGVSAALKENPDIEVSGDDLSNKISSAYDRVQDPSYQGSDLDDASKAVAESVVSSVKEKFDFGNEQAQGRTETKSKPDRDQEVADKALELVAVSLMESGPIKQLLGDNPADDNVVLAQLAEAVKQEMDIESGSAADLVPYLKGVFETVKESSYQKNLDGFSAEEQAKIKETAYSIEELVERELIPQLGDVYVPEGAKGRLDAAGRVGDDVSGERNRGLESAQVAAMRSGATIVADDSDIEEDRKETVAERKERQMGATEQGQIERVATGAANGEYGPDVEDMALGGFDFDGDETILSEHASRMSGDSSNSEQAPAAKKPTIARQIIEQKRAQEESRAAGEEPDAKRQRTEGGRDGR